MPKLKRTLGLFESSVYGIGLILGAGIYVLIGKSAAITGNSLWFSFLLTAIIASFTGLSYAELSSMFPKSAAAYFYVKNAFKENYLPFVVSWLIIFTQVFTGSAVALGFSEYFQGFVGIESPILWAILLIVGLSLLNFYGIKESAKLNVIFTLIEALGLVFIIYLGLGYIGSVNYFEMPNGIGGVFTGAGLIFFAYLGFQEIANITEETKDATKNIPIAIIISIIVTTVLYVLVAISVVSIVPWQTLGEAEAPLTFVAESAMPNSSLLLTIIALFATLNTVLITLIVASRMIYGVSRDTKIFKTLSKVHKKRRTPWVAVLVTMFLVSGFTLLGEIKLVALIADVGSFMIFMVVNISLIVLRYKKPNLKRPFKVPLSIGRMPIIPLLGLVSCFLMILHFEFYIILSGILIVGTGFLVFYLKDKFT